MSERTSYAPGTPCWVDLATPDVEASARFYGELLGWEVPENERSAELGGYRRAQHGGADVAGVYPLMAEGQPAAWATHIAVADADATAAKVKEAGGQVMAEPMDVMEMGRLAVFLDSTGAAFGVWQPGTFAGAARVNEPGALIWNELNTRDTDAARRFYSEVFGWAYREQETKRPEGVPGPDVYIEILLAEGDEESIGGMLDMKGVVPDEVPPHWLAYFAVEDADASVETVRGAGGGVMVGPIDIPAGRFAVVTEPGSDAAFAVIQQPS